VFDKFTLNWSSGVILEGFCVLYIYWYSCWLYPDICQRVQTPPPTPKLTDLPVSCSSGWASRAGAVHGLVLWGGNRDKTLDIHNVSSFQTRVNSEQPHSNSVNFPSSWKKIRQLILILSTTPFGVIFRALYDSNHKKMFVRN